MLGKCKAWGVKYVYSDQFTNTIKLLPLVFTTKEKAREWCIARPESPYWKIVELEVDPDASL